MQGLQEILPNVWTYEVATREYQVRSLIIIGAQQAVVWDTLTHPSDMVGLTEIIGDLPYHVIYSHGDWDHVWGTGGLEKRPLDIIAHSECLRRFGDDVPRTLRRMQLTEPGKWETIRLIPPDLTFTSRLSLDLGGVTLELHYLPGHSADSIVGWIPEWGVLLGGDAIETPLPVVTDASLLAGWQAALEEWASHEHLKRTLPSHGSIEGRECIDQTLAYLRALTGDRQFALPRILDDFYRETHQKNMIVVDGGLSLHG